MDLSDEFELTTVYEPNGFDFKETSVEPRAPDLTRRFPSKGFPRTPSTMTAALEDMLREAHRVHSHLSQREDLSCQSVVVVSVRQNGATCWGTERGDPTKQSNQGCTNWNSVQTDKRSRFLPSARQKLTDTNFKADYDRRSVRKLGEIIESQQEELHCAQAGRTSTTRSTASSWTVIAAKFGIT